MSIMYYAFLGRIRGTYAMTLRRSALTVVVFFTSVSIALACGTERWAVKIGTDRDADKVNMTAEDTTIAELSDLRPPPSPNTRSTTRFMPAEFKTFRIKGILTLIKKETDEDYHIVVQAEGDKEGTMIVESPDPKCAKGSQFLDQIKQVRKTIDDQFGPIKRRQRPNIPVTVMGVGFYDPIHGQEGVAPNGIELHPILEISFE
jgi:hypothetical protein